MNEDAVALVLGGWSPGPLNMLGEALRHRGVRMVHSPLPMPPCGTYWLMNPFVPLLFVGLPWATIVACDAAAAAKSAPPPLAVLLTLGAACVAARALVGGLVRFSVAHGVANAERTIAARRVVLVVGFSWGGGVAHALLHKSAWRGPTLLLNPTTVLNHRYALARPGRVDAPGRVAVVVSAEDPFCPPSTVTLYEKHGVDVARVDDDHSLCGRGAFEAILDAVDRLLAARDAAGGAPA
jgi:hypothetical protein